MSTAREIAIDVLPHFAKNVLSGHVFSYGVYAKAIGRNQAKESMVIGKAMHAIGGVCVLVGIPVAPLHFVERADGEWRGVFESEFAERTHVLPHYDLLCVTARIHRYTEKDFERVEHALRETLPKYLRPDQLSPHDIWHLAIYSKRKDSTTPWQRAIAIYQAIFDAAQSERTGKAAKDRPKK
jgi:hypothetical protein